MEGLPEERMPRATGLAGLAGRRAALRPLSDTGGNSPTMATTEKKQGPDTSEVLDRVEAENIEFVRFWFTDILGQLKSFAVGKEELPGAFEDGMGFDGSSITGFNRIEESDMIAMPDPDTFQVLPWRGPDHKVGRLFCDILTPHGEPYEGDPRFAMRRGAGPAKGN